MRTREYIDLLKDTTRKEELLAFRQALCWHLYKIGIPISVMSKLFGIDRRGVYYRMYTCRDMLEVNDEFMEKAMEEVKRHSYRVNEVPRKLEFLMLPKEYKLKIDNIIY